MNDYNEQPHRSVLRPTEVECIYGISASHLQKLRMRGDGPSYIKPTHRMVLYRRADIEAWLDLHQINSTSEQPA